MKVLHILLALSFLITQGALEAASHHQQSEIFDKMKNTVINEQEDENSYDYESIDEADELEELEEELGIEWEDISLDKIESLEKKQSLSEKTKMFIEILKVYLKKAKDIADKQISDHKLAYSLTLIASSALVTTLVIWLTKPKFLLNQPQHDEQ